MKEKKLFRLGSPSPQPYSDVSGQMCIGYGAFFGIEVQVTLQENCFHPPSSCWKYDFEAHLFFSVPACAVLPHLLKEATNMVATCLSITRTCLVISIPLLSLIDQPFSERKVLRQRERGSNSIKLATAGGLLTCWGRLRLCSSRICHYCEKQGTWLLKARSVQHLSHCNQAAI